MRQLLYNGTIVTKDSLDTVIDDGWILINDGMIENIGNGSFKNQDFLDINKFVDLKNGIVIPGLINCHTHFSQSLLRRYKENLVLEEWLEKVIRPFQDGIEDYQVFLTTQLSIAENLRHGITTIIDHHKLYNPKHLDVVLNVVEKSGIRAGFMIGCNDKIISQYENIDEFFNNFKRINSHYDNERFFFGYGPTSLRNCSDQLMQRISETSSQYKLPIHIHIAETEDERRKSIGKYGLTPVKVIDKLGLLTELTQLVHCIYVDDEEINLIKQQQSHVVFCPISNLFLGSGYHSIAKILSKGIDVVIGTDGAASGISQDILQNIKISSLLLKSTNIKSDFSTASTALYMVTKWAGEMLGHNDLGQLITGAKADLVVINTNNLSQQPVNDPQFTVVFNTSFTDICFVMVNGEILFEKGKLRDFDEEYMLKELCVLNV